MSVYLTINGVQRTPLRGTSVRIAMPYNERMTADMTFEGYIPSQRQEIVIYKPDNVTPMFGGLVMDVDTALAGSNEGPMVCDVTCADWWAYLDWRICSGGYLGPPVPIASSSATSPTTITTSSPHGFSTGDVVVFEGHVSTPTLVGSSYTATVTGANTFTVRQKSNGRFMDAHEIASKDFSVVTRPAQNNDTQRWVFAQVGAVYTIRQKSNGRFMDAHEDASKDFSVVSRAAQNNDTQRWVLLPVGDGSFTMQQLSNGRFVDAHEDASKDFSVVTRPAQNNDTQRWLFTKL